MKEQERAKANKSKLSKLTILLIGIIFILSLIVFVQNIGKLFPSNANRLPIVSNNYASMDEQNILLEEICTFRVADKLIGNGVVKLSLGKDKFTGTVIGTGQAAFCTVDLNADIAGVVNDTNRYINLTIAGVVDPQGTLIPGTVHFDGPLKGTFQNDKISLSGKIHLRGWLTRFARFEEVEDLSIEIPYQSFAQTAK